MIQLTCIIVPCPIYKKNNQYPCYINVGFNHPIQVFKHIPNGIMVKLSTNSSNIDIFS